MTLMWDDNVGEGIVKLRDNFDHAGWVTKMDFLTDVISELEEIRAIVYNDLNKPQGTYRF